MQQKVVPRPRYQDTSVLGLTAVDRASEGFTLFDWTLHLYVVTDGHAPRGFCMFALMHCPVACFFDLVCFIGSPADDDTIN